MKKLLALAIVVVLLSGCVTNTMVRIDSTPENAEVYIDNEKIGQTPVVVQMSNLFWKDPDVIIKAEGYKDLYTSLDKEVKIVNLISGIVFFGWPLLWVWGPEKSQYYNLIEE